MKAVFKYTLGMVGTATSIKMPKGAKVVSAGWQDSDFGRAAAIWAEVDPHETKTEERLFIFIPTGEHMAGSCRYNGRIESPEGFVFHVYELFR